jgi:hypothetical protein
MITAINPTAREPEKGPSKRIRCSQMSAIATISKRRKRSGGKTIRTIGKNIAPTMIGTLNKTGFVKGSETVPVELCRRAGLAGARLQNGRDKRKKLHIIRKIQTGADRRAKDCKDGRVDFCKKALIAFDPIRQPLRGRPWNKPSFRVLICGMWIAD